MILEIEIAAKNPYFDQNFQEKSKIRLKFLILIKNQEFFQIEISV